jgi:hypothetical protein
MHGLMFHLAQNHHKLEGATDQVRYSRTRAKDDAIDRRHLLTSKIPRWAASCALPQMYCCATMHAHNMQLDAATLGDNSPSM